jgi:hypothetical protein
MHDHVPGVTVDQAQSGFRAHGVEGNHPTARPIAPWRCRPATGRNSYWDFLAPGSAPPEYPWPARSVLRAPRSGPKAEGRDRIKLGALTGTIVQRSALCGRRSIRLNGRELDQPNHQPVAGSVSDGPPSTSYASFRNPACSQSGTRLPLGGRSACFPCLRRRHLPPIHLMGDHRLSLQTRAK